MVLVVTKSLTGCSQEDVFIVKAVDLGKLTKVKIRHDNKGMGGAWFLDRVEIEDARRKKRYIQLLGLGSSERMWTLLMFPLEHFLLFIF